jgi:P2 family phage contractile tail tube protein
MATPRILKNFNVIVNGRGLAGVADSGTLPEVSVKTDEHRAGGMDAPTEIDMGMDALSAKWSMKDPDLTVLGLAGQMNSNSARVTFRGSFVRDADMSRVAVIAECVGRIKKNTYSDWKAGDATTFDFEMSVNYYKLTVGGVEVYEIDVENMIRRCGGVDQLAGIRADIGL